MRKPYSALVYPASRDANGWSFLLLRRVPRPDIHLDSFWQGVTGGVEDNETTRDAAKREAGEELGFLNTRPQPIGFSYSFPIPPEWNMQYESAATHITEDVFVVVLHGQPSPTLSAEHSDWKWCRLEEALSLLHYPDNKQALREAHRFLTCIQPADTMNDTQRFYDLTAQSTADEWYPNHVLLPTLRDFLSLLPPQPRILDLGCGPGYESMRLTSLGAQVLGIDFSANCIVIAEQRNPSCTFRQMDFFTLDQSLGGFHGVLASGSLIHVPADRMPDLLSRIGSVLLQKAVLAAIIRDGTDRVISNPVVSGIELERIIYRYTLDQFCKCCGSAALQFLREGVLDEALHPSGWRCYFFQKL